MQICSLTSHAFRPQRASRGDERAQPEPRHRAEPHDAYIIDHHAAVDAFVKNAGLGFAIPYLDNGEAHDYEPDFIIHLKSGDGEHLILETKGYDKKAEIKAQAAERWVSAVNAANSFGRWRYKVAWSVGQVRTVLDEVASIQNA